MLVQAETDFRYRNINTHVDVHSGSKRDMATGFLIIVASILLIAFSLKISPAAACSGMLAPMMLDATSRNALVGTPLSQKTMTEYSRGTARQGY